MLITQSSSSSGGFVRDATCSSYIFSQQVCIIPNLAHISEWKKEVVVMITFNPSGYKYFTSATKSGINGIGQNKSIKQSILFCIVSRVQIFNNHKSEIQGKNNIYDLKNSPNIKSSIQILINNEFTNQFGILIITSRIRKDLPLKMVENSKLCEGEECKEEKANDDKDVDDDK
ncbi:hypothetical protein ACTA71_011822 [Dictyostelium dimigraforme]